MDFALNADQVMIRDTAEAFLAKASSSAAVRRAMESPTGYDEETWRQLAGELAWCATAIPEEYDGLGLGSLELTLLMEQCGRRLLCAPFFSTAASAASLLLESGNAVACERYLPAIAAGKLAATVAWSAAGVSWQPAEVRSVARQQDGEYVITGDYRYVLDAAVADLLLVPVHIETGELALFAVDAHAPGVTCAPLESHDASRRPTAVQLHQVRLGLGTLIATGDRLDRALPRASAYAMIALAAEQLGGAQECLDMTLAYVAERKQFGRAIASFQAVKHRCAEMLVHIEACRSAVYGAARIAATAPETPLLALEAATAKALASDTYFFCAQEAIQLHGGVGFTWEYDPQLHFKRAQATSHWFGTADDLREQVASHLLDGN
ncbi:MAG: acyl-CoA/acyl-ACP dehydrogenase [Rhodocyclales bacterium]|nr:acyl-CoA/acyl-ACP dehydrogenase [Rhodocyclales bacterium]